MLPSIQNPSCKIWNASFIILAFTEPSNRRVFQQKGHSITEDLPGYWCWNKYVCSRTDVMRGCSRFMLRGLDQQRQTWGYPSRDDPISKSIYIEQAYPLSLDHVSFYSYVTARGHHLAWIYQWNTVLLSPAQALPFTEYRAALPLVVCILKEICKKEQFNYQQ
jgi:hypothetical protein